MLRPARNRRFGGRAGAPAPLPTTDGMGRAKRSDANHGRRSPRRPEQAAGLPPVFAVADPGEMAIELSSLLSKLGVAFRLVERARAQGYKPIIIRFLEREIWKTYVRDGRVLGGGRGDELLLRTEVVG